MTRVVIDTNVLVSALLKARGTEASVLRLVADGGIAWCVSAPILAEYRDVLMRPKFSKIPRAYLDALLALAGRAARFTPANTLTFAS